MARFPDLYFALLGPIEALVLFRFALVNRALDLLGGYSYEIYIIHGAFVYSQLHPVPSRTLYGSAILAGVLLWGFRKLMNGLWATTSFYF